MSISRRRFLTGSALSLTVGACYGRFVEPSWFRLHREQITLNASEPLACKILHLSDLHFEDARTLAGIETAISLGLAEKPDLICLTGDYISHVLPDRVRYVEVLSRLSRYAPTYATLGNHDGGRANPRYPTSMMRGVLEEAGIECLHNRSTVCELGERKLRLVGVGDPWSGEMNPAEAYAEVSKEQIPTVLLSHNPDTKDELRRFPWELMLAGHTHGGQIVVPLFDRAPIAPIGDRRFTRGLYPWGRRWVFVTRGVASTFRIRFNCRPEVALLTVLI